MRYPQIVLEIASKIYSHRENKYRSQDETVQRLKQLVAQFMKDGMDTESIVNHSILIFQNL